MTTSDAKIEFQPETLFYDSVMSFQGAITGLLLFHPSVERIVSSPVGLASAFSAPLYFPPEEIRARFRLVGFDITKITDGLVTMLINSTFEIAKAAHGTDLHRFGPELEFFRHLRNAASHNRRWHFTHGEPRRPASWRGKSVTADLQGNRIWDVGIKPGDVLLLLHDVQGLLAAPAP